MRIGCCASMVAPSVDPIGIDTVETLADLGFDYVELSLADIARLPPAGIDGLRRRLAGAGLACEACNNFFPAQLRLTGPDADLDAAIAHAGAALDRARDLGASVVVFGSGPAKRVPEGFPMQAARAQIVTLLGRLGDMAAARGITVVIEPLNRRECNIVTTAAEGLELMRSVDHPAIRLLVDAYHLLAEHESPDIIERAGGAIAHCHVAAGLDRRFPRAVDADLAAFIAALTASGYTARLSVEAFTDDFAADARRALPLLRALVDPSRDPIHANA